MEYCRTCGEELNENGICPACYERMLRIRQIDKIEPEEEERNIVFRPKQTVIRKRPIVQNSLAEKTKKFEEPTDEEFDQDQPSAEKKYKIGLRMLSLLMIAALVVIPFYHIGGPISLVEVWENFSDELLEEDDFEEYEDPYFEDEVYIDGVKVVFIQLDESIFVDDRAGDYVTYCNKTDMVIASSDLAMRTARLGYRIDSSCICIETIGRLEDDEDDDSDRYRQRRRSDSVW